MAMVPKTRRITASGLLLCLALAAGCGGPLAQTVGLKPPPAFQQAETYYQKGDLATARENFRFFARRNPRSPFTPWAFYWMGKTDLKQEKFETAEYSFRRALEYRPEELLKGPLYMALGDVNFERRRYRRAVAWYRKIDADGLATTVRKDELYFKTGLAFHRTGQNVLADRNFRKLERYPGSPFVQEARRRTGRNAIVIPQSSYVSLGDYSEWSTAERVRKRAGNAGFSAMIETTGAGYSIRYEVRVPISGNSRQVALAAERLRSSGLTAVVVP